MVKRTWLVIETQNLSISAGRRSNPRPCQAFANSRLISCNVSAMWLYALLILEVLFFVFPLVFANPSFTSVSLLISE